MANEEHLEIIKKGSVAWNDWRKNHPSIQPDLSDAGLNDLELKETNLTDTNLIGTNFGDSTLWNADF